MDRILVVDDEERIRDMASRVLGNAGFVVDTVGTGQEARAAAAAVSYQLVVLDLMLPDTHGIVVLKHLLTDRPDIGVLVLSAVPEIDQRVRALDMGALDFLAKPFAIDELVARVRARLRRSTADPAATQPMRALTGGGVRLDAERHELRLGQRRVGLSQREFALLNYLMRRAGAVCTREELLADVWGYQFDPGTNVVDVYVRRLRTKLHPAELIGTVRNVGYRFAEG